MWTCYSEDNQKTLLRHVAADMLVIKDDKILLEKRAKGKLVEGGKYCLPGGHIDRDETIAQGALRELKEETGYDGKILSLFKINDNPDRKGEDRQNIQFVFLVEVEKQTSQPDDESEFIKWFDLDNLPPKNEFSFDHHEMIQLYLKYVTKKNNIPVLNI